MELLELKREINNKLFRYYHSISENNDKKEYYFHRLIDYNLDLIIYTIKEYFPELIYHKTIYEVGLVGLIVAIENYQLDKIGSFEEFVVENIRNEIGNYNQENHPMFVIMGGDETKINMGDIWYNKTHNVSQTMETKKNRDVYVKKLLKNSFN